MTAQAALISEARAQARVEECRHSCEVCRAVPGIAFTDRTWTCAACAPEVLARLRAERWQTAGRLRKRNKR